MTPRQIQLVRSSFELVAPIADVAATIFYRRLFDLDPAVRALFPTDLTAQKRNLMQTLTVVVKNLDRLEGIIPAVEALGERHATYRVRRDDSLGRRFRCAAPGVCDDRAGREDEEAQEPHRRDAAATCRAELLDAHGMPPCCSFSWEGGWRSSSFVRTAARPRKVGTPLALGCVPAQRRE